MAYIKVGQWSGNRRRLFVQWSGNRIEKKDMAGWIDD